VKKWLKARGFYNTEKLAEKWLNRQGLVTLAKNHHCRQGELDLVMRDRDGTLAFIEVRMRSDSRHGGALASVDGHKQRRLVAAARHYLARFPHQASGPCRFDVVAVEPDHSGRARVQWVKNAFYAE
jgi:putative endonuclease